MPEKYGSSSRPVLRRTSASAPPPRSSSQNAGGAPVLPDDRRRDRLRRGAVPHDGGLALVGDADAGDGGGGDAGLRPAPRAPWPAAPATAPPASCSTQPGCGVLRRRLLLGAREDGAGGVDDERPAARGARVEGQHQLACGRLCHAALRESSPPARLRRRAPSSWPVMIPAARDSCVRRPPSCGPRPPRPSGEHPILVSHYALHGRCRGYSDCERSRMRAATRKARGRRSHGLEEDPGGGAPPGAGGRRRRRRRMPRTSRPRGPSARTSSATSSGSSGTSATACTTPRRRSCCSRAATGAG